MEQPDAAIDITDEVCPMTFIRAKIQLEKMEIGQVLAITLRGGEPLHNVPRAMLDHGHEILANEQAGQDLHKIIVKKRR